MKVGEVKLQPPKILLWGALGTGKTLLALTVGRAGIVYDLDGGLRSAQTFKDKFSVARLEVEAKQCLEDDPGKATAFVKFKSYLQSAMAECQAGTFPWEVIVIDSLTVLSEVCLRYVLSMSGKLNKPPERQHWGMRDGELEQVLLTIKAIPRTVILIGHQQTNDDEKTKTSTIEIAMQGRKFPPRIGPKFDEILYVRSAGAGRFTIQTSATAMIAVRTRGQLPDGTDVNLGMPEILRLLGSPLKNGVGTVPAPVVK
jgi:hypothetical protein